MLVALGIFVILATLTLGAFRGVSKDDQISAASQTVKGWFEHARSKAIRNKSAYGLRFVPESNSGRYCTTVSYLSAGAFDESDSNSASNQKWIKPVCNSTTGVLTGQIRAYGASIADWRGFVDSGALPKPGTSGPGTGNPFGLRIEIPKNSGQWFPLTGVTQVPSSSPPVYLLNVTGGVQNLMGSYISAGDPGYPLDDDGDGTADNWVAQKIEYRLELSPVVEQGTATSLPRGIVIDLDASVIPTSWRPAATGASYPGGATMDVVFKTNGTMVANEASPGQVLHLCISTLEDAEAVRNSFNPANTPPPVKNHPSLEPVASNRFYPFLLADPKTSQKFVSVFLGSGRISTAVVNAPGDTDNKIQNELLTGNAILYAIHGRESK
jgi:type II secretory pathway pseudopilin PulG